MVAVTKSKNAVLAALLSVAGLCHGQLECLFPPVGSSNPVAAAGIEARVVSASLTRPRGMVFDAAGHLLVLDKGVGIVALTLEDHGGSCVTSNSSKMVVSNEDLNHGIEMIGDNLLIASSTDKVFTWNYNPNTASITSAARTVVEGMFNTDHASRTITKSRKKVGTIIVNRGSQSNIDRLAVRKASGHAQIRSFNLIPALRPGAKPYDFTRDGYVMGWGLRNNIGIAEHPATGGIWSVENSVDNIKRAGMTFNEENPAEKLNYLGTVVNNKSPNQGANFGYPYCYAAWSPELVPEHGDLQVGQQFSIDQTKVTDAQCRERVAPRLSFDAHMAPIDIVFHPNGQAAYVTFHGSFNRPVPQGYKLSKIAFRNGNPVAPSTSKTAAIDLVTNAFPDSCPVGCFRPTGIALGSKNRLFFASDATGEVFVVSRSNGQPL